MSSSLPLIQELARAAESDVTKDQLVLLFEREIAESVGKIEYRRLCIELRANMRLRNDYISELRLYRSCDDVLGSIAMLRTMQSDDSENAARLLSLQGAHRKVESMGKEDDIKDGLGGIVMVLVDTVIRGSVKFKCFNNFCLFC
ncbi:hypothetical protein Tco_1123043 [Tanacetum coccineum]|uniref:Uncharacterized protein n=1 Tax=Tanacetum coccineum TaxID=301880 RepID=A0ABQ5J4T5_9ASTR